MTNNIRYDLLSFMATLAFPEEAVNELIAALDVISSHKLSRERLDRIVENYRDNGKFDIHEVSAGAAYSSAESNISSGFSKNVLLSEYTSKLLFYMCCAMYSYPAFEKKGLSREEWLDSMADFRCKLFECHDRYGIWGTFVDWFGKWYTGDRTTYGRFSFEIEESPVSFKNEHFNVETGQKVIKVHILNNKNKEFSEKEWTKAFERAENYFKDKLDGADPVFYCHSWLLFPEHREMLPENSNILKFMSEFEEVGTWPSKNDLWRIFHIEDCNSDPADFPEETTLQRAYKKFMLDGGEPCCTSAFRLPNSKRNSEEN